MFRRLFRPIPAYFVKTELVVTHCPRLVSRSAKKHLLASLAQLSPLRERTMEVQRTTGVLRISMSIGTQTVPRREPLVNPVVRQAVIRAPTGRLHTLTFTPYCRRASTVRDEAASRIAMRADSPRRRTKPSETRAAPNGVGMRASSRARPGPSR